jgi:tRNA A37 methylthiotransferase MiaB
VNFLRGKFYGQPGRVWYIKVESGCVNCCTYCSDRLAYKWIKSVPIEKILKQFEVGLQQGYRLFNLVGRDLGSYGYDMKLTLADLLNEMKNKYSDQRYKLYLTNVSPNSLIDIYPKTDAAFLAKKVFELGSHIQSGSQRILKLMGKEFSIEDWLAVIKDIDKNYPNIRTRTSIMVGFPSETEDDYRKTIDLVNNELFDRIDVYSYDERPNVPSLKLKAPIDEQTKRRRYNEMRLQAFLNNVKKRIRRLRIAY